MGSVTEAELAQAVIDFLSPDHEIYKEVQTCWGRPDIVAACLPILWAVEVKKTLSLQVLGQALDNAVHGFHYSSVAVPKPQAGRKGKAHRAARHFAKQNGIGIIYVNRLHRRITVVEDLRARFNRHPFYPTVVLTEEQKTFADAGNAQNEYYTPFRGTKKLLIDYVAKHPGCSVRDAMSHIDHHYYKLSTAMSCTRQWIREGVISGIELRDGGLYPTEQEVVNG